MDIQTFLETFQFSLESTKPLYQQLFDYFKRMICSGVLKEGDQMIPEIAICENLQVSRATVRKAMDMLIEEGFIIRRRGKGSYVADRRMRRPINYLYNFTENMTSIGVVPSSIVIDAKVVDSVSDDILEELQLPKKNAKVFYLHRIRLADGKPMLSEKTYIPYYLCLGIEQYDFSKTSLYDVLSQTYMLNLYHATETIEAIIIDKEEETVLECDRVMPGYRIKRVSYTDSKAPYEYTTSITRADRCVFQMELYKNTSSNNVPVQMKRNMIF